MKTVSIIPFAGAAVLALSALTPLEVLSGGMFDMMNPSRWFDDDDDRYYRYGRHYGYGPYGWGGPHGWGGGPYGWGGGPYGWGGAPYGWGYPGYGPGNTIVVTPPSREDKSATRLPE